MEGALDRTLPLDISIDPYSDFAILIFQLLQVLASRIEDALDRNLPLDGLTGDKQELPPHMRCGASRLHTTSSSECHTLLAVDAPHALTLMVRLT